MKGFLNIKFFGVVLILLFSCNEDKINENEFGTLKGQVVASGTNQPLADVKISTDPVSSTVFTDDDGKFTINDIAAGDYSVQAKKDGYLADFEPATVNGNATSNVVFELLVSTANNRPPSAPELLTPTENEVLSSIEAVFSWSSTDPEGDPLEFSIELRNDQNNDVLLFEELTDSTFTYSPLMLGAKYFWQVTASDNINDPVISPIGTFEVMEAPGDNRFLFVRKIGDNNVIFSADEEGNEFQLTSQEVNSYRPRRHVAGDKIAYLQSNGANVDIYTMNRDGTEKFRVTSTFKPNGFNLNEINFSWPADTDRIYYPQLDKLYRVNSNGQSTQLVYQTPDGSLISEVAVSENTNLIVLKTNNLDGYDVEIYTIDFNGNVLDTVLSGVDGAVSGLSLSVTNQQILYSYDVSGFEAPTYRRLDSRMFIYDMTGATTTDISGDDKPGGTNDLDPIFSPNEAFVIFTNTSNDGISQRDIYSMEILQNERTLLFENAFMPDWE